MLKRLLLGLVIGVVLGGLAGFGLMQADLSMHGPLAYAFAALMGVIVGLVAGKPIWAKGARIEAGLKAFMGALLGVGILFGLRFVPLTLPAIAGVAGAPIGEHAIGALVSIATILALFYEIDDGVGGDAKEAPRARVAAGGKTSPKRVASGEAADLDDDEAEANVRKQRK